MSAQPEQEPQTVDPVSAAVAKYQSELALPALNAASPDEVLIAHLFRGTPTRRVQEQIAQAHQHARTQRFAAVPVIDTRMAEYSRKLRDYQAGNVAPGSRNAADWRAAIGTLRLALDTLAWLVELTERWERMSDGDRQVAAQQQMRDLETQWAIANSNRFAATHHRDWGSFLGGLRERGVVIVAGKDGTLEVHGRALTQIERAEVTASKAAILAALAPVEII